MTAPATSTNPVEPAAPVTAVKAVATAVSTSWFKIHEKLIVAVLLLASCGWLGNKWIDAIAAKDNAAEQVAMQQLSEEKAKDAQAAVQVATLTTQYQQLAATVAQENAQLMALVQQRNVALQKQQTTDKTMTPSQLASRWANLVEAAPADIASTPTGLSVTEPVALDTVEQLEQVPVLQENLSNETSIADANASEVTKANALNRALTNQVGDLKQTITDDDKACKVQIAAIKADANKSKVKWFKVGFVTGFISGLFTGHYVKYWG